MPVHSAQLPERVREVIPVIQPRLERALLHHIFKIHTFDPNGNIVTFDTVSADVVANVTAKIIERMIMKGTLRFQGMTVSVNTCRLLVASVERVVASSYEGKYFFIHDSKEIVACALRLFLIKQHVVVVVDTTPASRAKPRKKLSLPRPSNASLH